MIVNLSRYENTKDVIELIKKELERRKKNMSEKLDPVGKEDEDPDNDGTPNTDSDKYILKRRQAIAKNIKKENMGCNVCGGSHSDEDHEVSMARSSVKSIIKSAVELYKKLGNEERNIPGWIQDHITNAENYIDQAAQGFHELNEEDDILKRIKDIPNKIRANKEKIKKAVAANPYNAKKDDLPFGKTPSNYKAELPNKPDDYDDPYDE